MKKIIVFCMIVMLMGCAALEANRAAQLRKRPLAMGMTMAEVEFNVDVSHCKSTASFNNISTEVWAYKPFPLSGKPTGTFFCREAYQRIHFRDGLVIGWENIK